MVFELGEVIRDLRSRETDVATATRDEELKELENALSVTLGADFKTVYSAINGFLEPDHKSQIFIWSDRLIKENVKNYPIFNDSDGVRWLSIGDFLLDSDIIVASVELDQARTKFLYEDRVLSDSILNFVGEIALGKFDFL